MAIVYDGLASGSLRGASLRILFSFSILESLSTLILRLLALAVLLALTARLLAVLLGLTVCCTLSSHTNLSIGAIKITSHQQQDENYQEENKGKEA